MNYEKVKFLFTAFLIRLIVVYIAKLIDENSTTNKFTDTDYEVFSDAATHVYNGGSPFARHTYRYTPLAAYICLVNNFIHPLAGKIVFCICDIILGFIFWEFVDHQRNQLSDEIKAKTWKTKTFVALWIYNPMIVAMPTRGSNDNIISLFLFIALYYMVQRKFIIAGLFYGLSVHFKIYPIIYSFVLYFWIDMDYNMLAKQQPFKAIVSKKGFFTKDRLLFTGVSAGTFIGLTYLFYVIYGYEFLYEAYLYHFIRKDHRHNNSIYFYLIYQLFDAPNSTTIAILTFLPQWLTLIVAGLFFYYDLWFCLLLQTWSFVIFNKVMTAQYYLWYLLLMPIVGVNNDLTMERKCLLLIWALFWAFGQINWGIHANNFENYGLPTIANI